MTLHSDLIGKVPIVTGGGRGIGKAIASALAAAGAKVAIAEIDNDTGKQAEKDLQSQGYEAHFIHTDVASSDSIKAAVTKTVNVFGSSIMRVSVRAHQRLPRAIKPMAAMPAYCATKEGVLALTRIAAIENGSNQIRVNAVAPGMTKTEILRNALTEMGAGEEAVGQQSILFGRCANPEETAESVLWLASERASYVTGIVIPVDGGYSLM